MLCEGDTLIKKTLVKGLEAMYTSHDMWRTSSMQFYDLYDVGEKC